MNKIFFNGLVMLALCGALALTACSDDNDNDNVNGQPTTEDWAEPTTDQMGISVTADLPTAALSQFTDKSTGAALTKRLTRVTANIANDTQMVLLKGSDINTVSDEVADKMACILIGDGYIAIETPTEDQLDVFFNKINKSISKYVTDAIDDVFILTPAQRQASIQASLFGRMQVRRANLSQFTRAADANDPCAELIIFGLTDYYYQEPLHYDATTVCYATDAEGNIVEERHTVNVRKWEPTDYHYGLLADGAAQWINDTEAEKKLEEETAEAPQAVTRGTMRVDGNKAINDMMSASETFTHDGKICYKTLGNEVVHQEKRCHIILRSWGVHNMNTNRDYYYVRQNVVLSMGKIGQADLFLLRGAAENGWSTTKNFGKYDLFYGNFLSQYETTMDLTGEGIINCEAATPETANQVTTQAVNTTSSSSTTETVGVSAGVTAGVTGGLDGVGLTLTATVTSSYSTGKTSGNSFSMTNSKSIKDLDVVKNSTGSKVRWNYTGKMPGAKGSARKLTHDIVPEILVNDANLVNDVCWSVENPAKDYTLVVTSTPVTGVLLGCNNDGTSKIEHTMTPEDTYTHKLMQPYRFLQKWRMFLVVDEWMGERNAPNHVKLENYFRTSFSDVYSDVFSICENEENSVLKATAIIQNGIRVFNSSKDIIELMARNYGIKKFTIYWRCDSPDIKLRNGYTVQVSDNNPF